jgi:hypothetical protein
VKNEVDRQQFMIVVDRQQLGPSAKPYWRVHADVGTSTERGGAGVVTNGDNQFASDVPFRNLAKKWIKKLMVISGQHRLYSVVTC